MKRLLLLLTTVFFTASAFAEEIKVDAHLSLSAEGDETTSFTADAPKLFAVFETEGTKKDASFRAVWIAEDVGTLAPANTKIDEATVKGPQDDFHGTFSISRPNKGWPVGKYRVELYLGAKLVKTLKFTIAAEK